MKQFKSVSTPALEGGTPVRKSFLLFGKPDIRNAEIVEVVDSLKSGWIGTGPKVAIFEKMVSDYIGSKYTFALSSCTAGLHLSLLACGVGPGDEVITSPMTFAATANVIEHVGATPVFADIELSSANINPDEIRKKISHRTKAVIPVHLAGRPCRMDEIKKIANKYKLKIIEDAAHAFGAQYQGRKIGTISDLTVFSFYVTKNLTTAEGGMVTTNNEQYANFIRTYFYHGLSKGAWERYSKKRHKNYLVMAPGYKYNMTDLQAAIGIHQFKRFRENQERRWQIWQRYNQAFANLPLQTPAEPAPNTKHAYHLYTILVDAGKLKANRQTIQAALHGENIGTGTHFISLHLHPYYKKKYGYKRGDFPNAEYVSDRTITLPLSSGLKDLDVEDVIAAVTKVLLYYQKNRPKVLKAKLPTLKKILAEKDFRQIQNR